MYLHKVFFLFRKKLFKRFTEPNQNKTKDLRRFLSCPVVPLLNSYTNIMVHNLIVIQLRLVLISYIISKIITILHTKSLISVDFYCGPILIKFDMYIIGCSIIKNYK